jgi:plastocyanin domain-containing protein
MKKSMFFIFAIIFMIAVGVAFAGVFEGRVTSLKDDKSSLAVKSKDKKEYVFECDKGVIPNAIDIGDNVKVYFKEEGNTKKATDVKPDIGC